MKTPKRLAVVITALVTLFGAHPALANTTERAAAIARAQEYFDDGIAAYEEEDYARAFEAFQDAYEQVPAAVFLYNTARVAQLMGRLDEALKFAERAHQQTDRPLPPKLVERNDVLIASLKESLKAADEEAERKKAAENPPFSKPVVMKYEPRQPKNATVKIVPLKKQASGGLSALGYSGIAVAAVGVGLLGAATYLSIDSSSKLDTLSELDTPEFYEQRLSEIEGQQALGRGLLYAGVAGAAIGGGLLAWDLIDGREHAPESASLQHASPKRLTLAISADATQVGMLLRGAY